MFKSVICSLFILTGCIVNPKYTDSKSAYDEQAEKYPKSAEFLKQQQKDFKAAEDFKNTIHNSTELYLITVEKKSGWSVGNPNAVIHVGNMNYKYHHRIKISLVCDKDSFLKKPFSERKVKWKVKDSISGAFVTSRTGEGIIRFVDESSSRFNRITITTEKKSYSLELDINRVIDLDKNECD